ncbi:S-adenosyl-L-methionine-dependent methyltransferase [Thelonectria olida]|uniref:S-adenosyl-L-methionine-dependent methyltransferase n=1 Tax=Thelonectria olida TaxID=1576542 RepID=A0A9P8VMB5_9HYPO|nr:S-adenosyl-L-methionine-dependent methyltransferase [Thelonectria olida]
MAEDQQPPQATETPATQQQELSAAPQSVQAATLEALPENPLQAEDEHHDKDSALNRSEGFGGYAASLSSSIVNYRYENGRRYHAFRDGAYLVPNDEEEQNRMDLGHHIYSLVLGGKLHLAPLNDTYQRVLDLGTGTGIWAIHFADENPSAEVLGTDLSPIQPEWIPPNCVFEVDDFESDWVYTKPFDYIHTRELEGCIGNEMRLFQQAHEHLAPGGYFEMQGVGAQFLSDDDTLEQAPNAQMWMNKIVEGAAMFGKPIDSTPTWAQKMKEAGFVDVKQVIHKIPIGPWPKDADLKEIGRFQALQEAKVIDSYTPGLFTRVLGWNSAEVQVFIAKIKKELKDPSIHLYLPVYFVWGRKAE